MQLSEGDDAVGVLIKEGDGLVERFLRERLVERREQPRRPPRAADRRHAVAREEGGVVDHPIGVDRREIRRVVLLRQA